MGANLVNRVKRLERTTGRGEPVVILFDVISGTHTMGGEPCASSNVERMASGGPVIILVGIDPDGG